MTCLNNSPLSRRCTIWIIGPGMEAIARGQNDGPSPGGVRVNELLPANPKPVAVVATDNSRSRFTTV